MKTIGERINFLRKSKNMSQRMVMEKLNISNLGRIERNERAPGIDIVISLAKYFEVSTDWILLGEGEEPSFEIQSLTEEELHLLANIQRLTLLERTTIEGIVQGLLLAKEIHANDSTNNESCHEQSIFFTKKGN